MENKRYKIRLEVVTPLSVGAGGEKDWVRGADYVQKGKGVYVLDMRQILECGFNADELIPYFLKTDNEGLCQKLAGRLDDCVKYVFPLPTESLNPIKTFIRNQLNDCPLVPGSSIKGAIRSALFTYLREQGEEENKPVFGDMKNGTDFMRFIQVGDIEMEDTDIVNTKIFNLQKEWNGRSYIGGWKHSSNKTDTSFSPTGFNTLYECATPGTSGIGNITFSRSSFEQIKGEKMPYAKKKQQVMEGGLTTLFQIINRSTRNYLLKEKAFFEKYNEAEKTDEILDNINSLLNKIPTDGSACLLKMSAGAGFHSITGDWQFGDYDNTGEWTQGRNNGKKKYKSRKIAVFGEKLQLMGFVMLLSIQ